MVLMSRHRVGSDVVVVRFALRGRRESATRHEGCRGAVVLQTSVSVLLHVGTMFFSCLDDRGDLLAAVLQSFVCPCL